jgi:hypothetical protein
MPCTRYGRGTFNQGGAIPKNRSGWRWSRIIAFDYPETSKQKTRFEERYQTLLGGVRLDHPFVFVSPRVKCSGKDHIC